MKVTKIDSYTKGWFVGKFTPTALETDAVEVAVKYYKAGDKEPSHHHKVAIEITVILDGVIKMNGELFLEGDVITVEPNESVAFEALTDASNLVVKMPSLVDDKYLD